METKQRLEIDYDRARVADLTTPHSTRSLQAELREQLVEIDRELGDHLRAMAAHSNPYWEPPPCAQAPTRACSHNRLSAMRVSTQRASEGLGMATPYHYFRSALDATARPVGAGWGERPLVNHQTLLLDDEVVREARSGFPVDERVPRPVPSPVEGARRRVRRCGRTQP